MNPESRQLLVAARSDAVTALGALSTAIRALLTQAPWEPVVRTATDLERATGLSHAVSWQVHRVGMTEEPLSEARHIPKRAALKRLCAAAQRVGTRPELLEEAERAFEAFEAMVQAIAGERETFAEMADAWCGKEPSQSVTPHLRQAFRSSRHIWGVSAKASFMTYIALPPGDPWLHLRGLCSLRSTRRSAWDVCGNRGHEIHGIEPLEIADHDTNLIRKYCRGPIPKLDRRAEDDWMVTRAAFEVSGRVTSHTLVFGERVSVHDRSSLRGRLFASHPVERMMVDLLAHRSLQPRLETHAFYAGAAAGSRQLASIPMELLERDDARSTSGFRELSSYGDLLEETLGLGGHALEDFIRFRTTCEYPPMGGILELSLQFDSPEGTS